MVAESPAGAGAGAGPLGALTNNTLLQIILWQLVGAAVGAVLAPYEQALTNAVNSATPLVPLSPADLALAVVRNIRDEASAAGEARQSGIDEARFHEMVLNTGDAPAPGDLAVALRRGLIDQARYLTGIRQGRLRDEWADLIRELAVQQPSPVDAMTAAVEGQLSVDEAKAKFAAFGGDVTQWDWLLGTVGSGPSPLEAATMAYRGVIPWEGRGLGVVSFEQAVLESHYRNKWLEPYRALSEYLPPPRTVTAMFHEGSLTRDQAVALLKKSGLTDELAAAYVDSGAQQKLAKTKDLAESIVRTLYRDRLIDRPTALNLLESLRYTAEEADFILSIVDVELQQRFLLAAVGRIHTLYVGHKISRATALGTLAQLKLPDSGIADIVGIWDYERAANVHTLTAAEIAAGFKAKLWDQATAQQKLEQLGYLPWDAWAFLSIHMKTALPNEPSPTAVGAAPGA